MEILLRCNLSTSSIHLYFLLKLHTKISITCHAFHYIKGIIHLFQNEDVARENITETLGTMAKVCLRMLENP